MNSSNKENLLSFHNISNMNNQAKNRTNNCVYHFDKKATFRSKIDMIKYCSSCGISEASRGAQI
jgi:hypothetical protein